MESDSQTVPSRILSHDRNLLSFDSNNPLVASSSSSTGTARLVLWLCGFAVLLKGFGSDILLGAPITRLIELAVCRRYLSIHNPDLVARDGYVDEVHCKVDDIQVEMALILGAVGLLSALVGTYHRQTFFKALGRLGFSLSLSLSRYPKHRLTPSDRAIGVYAARDCGG